MKEYCVDLEIAKKLKENGFPQKSLFMYDKQVLTSLAFLDSKKEDLIFAPNSDEILKELPHNIADFFELYINKYKEDSYTVEYVDFSEHYGHNTEVTFEDIKLSNTLAKMWLYLKKEGYLK